MQKTGDYSRDPWTPEIRHAWGEWPLGSGQVPQGTAEPTGALPQAQAAVLDLSTLNSQLSTFRPPQ